MTIIAALYVDLKHGPYDGLPSVECWDKVRDARLYAGPHPVVAHPPCARWCRLAKQIERRGLARVGDDQGCFEAALRAVRAYGGVLEHPAHSLAWPAFGLPRPHKGGWFGDPNAGWVCEVDQRHYGHKMRKSTWLYAFGVQYLPALIWGRAESPWVMSSASRARASGKLAAREVKRTERHTTPKDFADILLAIARSVTGEANSKAKEV